ncbi:hypothetical protein B0J13DRAFT_519711 [Dactylonectria estremocensis]|uniref:Uncharacterized protein n=1 Tax=Dactylonectria estremocensis TaxID=1079267 RepID=A0A9P9JBB6_9HYPO|nr:hypothetical protein B0J13DRAFT_519711 [Dactylonectria estremocensis]
MWFSAFSLLQRTSLECSSAVIAKVGEFWSKLRWGITDCTPERLAVVVAVWLWLWIIDGLRAAGEAATGGHGQLRPRAGLLLRSGQAIGKMDEFPLERRSNESAEPKWNGKNGSNSSTTRVQAVGRSRAGPGVVVMDF